MGLTKKEALKSIDKLRAVIEQLPDSGVHINSIHSDYFPGVSWKIMVDGINKIISSGLAKPENIRTTKKLGRLQEKRVVIDDAEFWQPFNYNYFKKLREEL